MILLPLIVGISLLAPPKAPKAAVDHFRPVPVSRFPHDIFFRDFCQDRERSECWTGFKEVGKVWAADINDDGREEFLVMPGRDFAGSAGFWFFLYQERGATWISIARPWQEEQEGSSGWQTRRPRFDVLPRTRNGYHDLRIEINSCLKWDGNNYVEYTLQDYRELSPAWFNAADNHEAEIFWAIRYSGLATLTFEPQWFPLAKNDFITLRRGSRPSLPTSADPPRLVYETLDDPAANVRWICAFEGGASMSGVWGVRGRHIFLLAPQITDGVVSLTLRGDWLVVVGEETQSRPWLRFNRRTHELQLDASRSDSEW